jgi:hypothetical protein
VLISAGELSFQCAAFIAAKNESALAFMWIPSKWPTIGSELPAGIARVV